MRKRNKRLSREESARDRIAGEYRAFLARVKSAGFRIVHVEYVGSLDAAKFLCTLDAEGEWMVYEAEEGGGRRGRRTP